MKNNELPLLPVRVREPALKVQLMIKDGGGFPVLYSSSVIFRATL